MREARARPPRRRRLAWRAWLRALHRDGGHFVIGLTLVYALSGLAVNHIDDWNPNFRTFERVHPLPATLPEDEQAAARLLARELSIDAPVRDVYRAAPNQLDVVFDDRTLHADSARGVVVEEGQTPRLLLRVANWLHLNRGKQAWTYVADAYAVLLLYLAASGLFMLPGRKGLLGRGGLIALAGAAVPIVYVVLSGGP